MYTMVVPMVLCGRDPTKKPQDSKQFADSTKPIKHQPGNTFQPATVELYHLQHIYTGQQNLTFFCPTNFNI